MTTSIRIRFSAILLACCLAAVTVLCSCAADKSKLTEAERERIALAKEVELVQASGGLVLMVEGDALSSDEVLDAKVGGYGPQADQSIAEALEPLARSTTIDQFKEKARPYVEDVLTNKISGILLYQHATREAEGNKALSAVIDGLVEKEWREYVLTFGGDVAKADAALVEKGSNREEFKEERRKKFTTQAFISSKFPQDEPITYSQLVECYDRIKDDLFTKAPTVTFRLIDIDVLKVGVGPAGENPMLKAKRLADELINKIRDGEDFGELAKRYSNGYRSSFGGLWDPVSPDSLARPYDRIVKAIEGIDVGQVAGPIDAGGHIFIVKLEDKQAAGYEPFEKVQRQVERIARAERENEIMHDIGEKYISQASAGKTDKFMDFCIEEIYKRSNVQAAAS